MDHIVEGRLQLLEQFLEKLLPEQIPPSRSDPGFSTMRQQPLTRDTFIKDIKEGMNVAPMAIRLTPHILSCIDWSHPVDDPLLRQFIPVKSALLPDHPELALDSLNETMDSAVNGLVHRYPDKVLFLGSSSSVMNRIQPLHR